MPRSITDVDVAYHEERLKIERHRFETADEFLRTCDTERKCLVSRVAAIDAMKPQMVIQKVDAASRVKYHTDELGREEYAVILYSRYYALRRKLKDAGIKLDLMK